MSRLLLCVALVVAMIASAQGAAVVYQQVYVGADAYTCGGTFVSNTTAFTTGVCQQFQQSSIARFCSADGANIYTVIYNDKNCTETQAYQISQQPTTCSWTTSGLKYQCVNAEQGPALPSSLAFPPSGWATSVQCENVTASGEEDVKVCSQPTGQPSVHCTQSAFRAGFCHTVGTATDVLGYEAAFCAADGQIGGMVRFSDAACTQVVRAELSQTGCNGGSQITCPSNGATFPSLPNQGYTEFDSTSCAAPAAGERAPRVVLLASDKCVGSEKFTCGAQVNGTQSATLKEYPFSAKETCEGTSTDYTAVVGACQKVGNTGRQFTCQYVVPGDNSAAAASTSFVALIIAAFVAMVAGKQL